MGRTYYPNWYTVDESDRRRGNNIVDAEERALHAEAEMAKAKADTEKYNKSLGSTLEQQNSNTPEFFVYPNCDKVSNPDYEFTSNYVDKFHVGIIK